MSVVVVISGPSGAGKGSIVERLMPRDPALQLSRSWTTRDRRPGESGSAYHFVTREQFEEHRAAEGFIEWSEHFDHLYGTPVPHGQSTPVPRGQSTPVPHGQSTPASGGQSSSEGDAAPEPVVILEIDVNGAEQVRASVPAALVIFVVPPSREEQERRLRGRGETDDIVARRLARADYEEARASVLADHVVVNDDLERAVAEIHQLITSHARAGAGPEDQGNRTTGE